MRLLTVLFTLLTTVVLILTPFSSFSSAVDTRADDDYGSPKPLWWHAHGGGFEDEGAAVAPTTDGGYIATGWTKTYGAGNGDVWLVKTNETGVEEWNRTYGGKGFDFGEGVLAEDNGYVIIGTTPSFGAGGMDFWLIKTDLSGNELWNRTYGGAGDDKGMAISSTTDGGYVITGYWKPGVAGWRQLWVIKTDSGGNIEWDSKLGGELDDEGWAVMQTTDGGYVAAGYTASYGAGGADLWLISMDANGTEKWNTTFGGIGDDFGSALIETSDGNYTIVGQTESFGNVYNDFDDKTTVNAWMLKVTESGTELWNRSIGNIWYEYAEEIIETDDGGYFMAGSSGSYHGENFNIFLMRLDENGTEQWSKGFGGKDYDFTYGMTINSEGGLVITGSIGSAGSGGTDLILLEFDPKMPVPVPNIPPMLTITNPAENATISGYYKITGTAWDDGLYLFTFVSIDNGSWEVISEDPDWYVFWNTTKITNGEHTVSARVFDGLNYSEIVTVTVIVNNTGGPEDEPEDEEEKDEVDDDLHILLLGDDTCDSSVFICDHWETSMDQEERRR
jgi:hypothetical protein